MHRLRTRASRWAAACLLAVGMLFVQRFLTSTTTVYSVLSGALAVTSVVGAAAMAAHNSFEAHLVAWLVVASTICSTLLLVTVGLPGDATSALSVAHVGLLVLSVMIAVLMWQDMRVRRKHARGARRPYAR